MLAPKALNLDNDSERTEDGSITEVSEDDIPLAVRLNLSGNSDTNTTGKQRVRSSFQKKGGFVIPRKKKQANGKLIMIFELKHFWSVVWLLNVLKFLARLYANR